MGGWGNTLSDQAYKNVYDDVQSKGGSVTAKAEERRQQGLGLHELVDPQGFGKIRISVGPRVKQKKGKLFKLTRGVGLLFEFLLDTTGSNRDRVAEAFIALPKTYKLLTKGNLPVAGRYDAQIINASFGDRRDQYILSRTQAEMDERIAEQMRYMNVEGQGWGDGAEDPQYGLFAAAYLTKTDVSRYGLKHYHFTATDDHGRELDLNNLVRVFGDDVFEKVAENGYDKITEKKLPKLKQVVADLQKNAHAFMFHILGNQRNTDYDKRVAEYWAEVYGAERVITITTAEYLAELQALVVGLTEGVITLETAEQYLVDEAELTKAQAKALVKQVAHIPLRAQADLPNFNKIPKAGDLFETKEDVWPVGSDDSKDDDDDEINWS